MALPSSGLSAFRRQRQQPWMMNQGGLGSDVNNSRGSHDLAQRNWTAYDGDRSGLPDPMDLSRQRARQTLGGLSLPSNSGAPLTGQQRGLLAARGMNYGPDPRYKQDPPDANMTPPQPSVNEYGQRSFGGNGLPQFQAGQSYRAYNPSPSVENPYAGRRVEVTNSPVTGGLRLVGKGPLPELTEDQLQRQADYSARRAANAQQLRDNRVFHAQRAYGLPDSIGAVAAANARRASSPAARFQEGLSQYQQRRDASNSHAAAIRATMLELAKSPEFAKNPQALKKINDLLQGTMPQEGTYPDFADYQPSAPKGLGQYPQRRKQQQQRSSMPSGSFLGDILRATLNGLLTAPAIPGISQYRG